MNVTTLPTGRAPVLEEGEESIPAGKSKLKVDWDHAERLYAAAQLSNHQIAQQLGISEGAIRKRMKKDAKRGHPWLRDLRQKVEAKVADILVREEVRAPDQNGTRARTEQEIVNEAAENAVAVVRLHRKGVSRAATLCGTLFEQLEQAVAQREDLKAIADEEAAEQGVFAAQRRAFLHRAISLPAHAGVIRDLTTALEKLQKLERAAWGMKDGTGENDDSYEAMLERHMKRG